MGTELLCYNKGCGKTFKEEENNDDSCCYHPGNPVFHDAMKGWSCCKKRSTDFTDFLNMPGCTRTKHNPVKPAEPVKNLVKPLEKGEVIEVKAPPLPKPKVPVQRPSNDEPHIELKVIISNSLKNSLARYRKAEEEKQKLASSKTESNTEIDDEVAIGTKCHRNGCDIKYLGPESSMTDCMYHPGIPIFHEGYKFWSCCRRRTSDFNEFLKQQGCKTGSHSWKPTEECGQLTRCDWHQTGSQVVISAFAKCCVPEECHFTANSTSVNCRLSYEGGKKVFKKVWNLEGVIEPSNSSVELLGTKAEIKLRKADGTPWKFLEIKKEKTPPPPTNNDDNDNDAEYEVVENGES